ncbi:MAG TPA: transglycosylase SLT domain-containing protein [Woeseiaceae bacterium]|nr:transglycosylase SLT domain-containing protein [Woeseiaceae bacterium]
MPISPTAALLVCLSALLLAGCASVPDDVDNICSIFEEKSRWYRAAKKSEERWGTPIHIQMAIIRQESSFKSRAKPPRKRFLGFIPLWRPSNAFGYAQALDSTWKTYQADTGRHGADRHKFKDAIDFVGWYTDQSQKIAGISKWDPYNQYLAYHEGQAGWQKKTYSNKRWLMNTAKRVDNRARRWGGNLKQCEHRLDKGWWIF